MNSTREQVLHAIVLLTSRDGYAPTIREIMDLIGLRSPDTVSFHLDRLRSEGRITWKRGAARTIRVLEKV